ncbi:MAG: phosphotransferase [Xanthomonadaceae bacterium]|jgi:aminoglycoside/choline kinase family phosphotransferase|nr:phosphotransferase [Xanthomonadaceae bacterium]
MTTALSDRHDERLRWARLALKDDSAQLRRASEDAGFRSYWRSQGQGPSRMLMDSPPALEDVRPWLRIHELLAAGGVRVPQILAEECDSGFLLLEDLGGPTLIQLLDTDNADTWFDAAITQLLRLQAIAPPADLGRFDEAALQRDFNLFEAWFLRRHLGLEPSGAELAVLADARRQLIENALAQPQVLTHRDFMPRNLMPADGGLAVLDFQDSVIGPIAYDPISLFKDAFLSWPPERAERWLAHYHARALDAGLPVPALSGFQRDADWLGVHRHLKILGIFSRLHYRDGKPRYLADAPRFIAYLDETLSRYESLRPLQALLDERVRPALSLRAEAVS